MTITTISDFYYALILSQFCLCQSSLQINGRKPDYTLVEVEDWSSCSTTCGTGIQMKKMICVESLLYSETVVSEDFCDSIKKPDKNIRECNHGDCGKMYYWRPSQWSECSQTCGNAGRKTRDVECVFDEGDGNFVTSNNRNCESVPRPLMSLSCNHFDCPPKFIPGKWEKCIKSRGCLPGKQRRTLDCIGILKNGKAKKMTRNACYKEIKPPVSWRKCNDHINTKECLRSNKREPEIETKKSTLIQMRKTKKILIQIGQLALVFPHTVIIIVCPVNYFVSRDILWKHKSTVYKFNGTSKERVKVDKKGRLRIVKFKSQDQGSWTCIAGSSNASSVIKSRSPSVGYQDWILRTALWNREMLNEDPQTGIVRQDVVQWIKREWSSCSVSCGGEGFQTREVHCEELDTRYYNILSDDVCRKRGQKKPDIKRVCLRNSQCPQWLLTNYDMNKCTDKCLRIGVAQISGYLTCIYQEKEIESNFCDKESMPQIDCPNISCQVKWKRSDWSQCSVSCGGNGIKARYLICVWKSTGETAGSLCYKENLFIPQVMKPCIAPKCILKCVDLSPNCQRKGKFCLLSLYRYMCCKTCYDDYMETKGNESSSEKSPSAKNTSVKKIARNMQGELKISTGTTIQ